MVYTLGPYNRKWIYLARTLLYMWRAFVRIVNRQSGCFDHTHTQKFCAKWGGGKAQLEVGASSMWDEGKEEDRSFWLCRRCSRSLQIGALCESWNNTRSNARDRRLCYGGRTSSGCYCLIAVLPLHWIEMDWMTHRECTVDKCAFLCPARKSL